MSLRLHESAVRYNSALPKVNLNKEKIKQKCLKENSKDMVVMLYIC